MIKKNKSAQTEIIGLVIVMVLVVMGIMFAMLFIFGKKDATIYDDFKSADLPQAVLDAIFASSSFSCTGRTVSEAFVECKSYANYAKCGSDDVCVAVHNDVKKILGATLGNWSVPYKFSFGDSASTSGGLADISSGSLDCDNIHTGSTTKTVLGNTIEVTLKTCD